MSQFKQVIVQATLKPILIKGVERRLMVLNISLSFLLLASARLHIVPSLVGLVFFVVNHGLLTQVSAYDSCLGQLFKRATRYTFQSYFPAKSYINQLPKWPVKTLPESV